MPDFIPAQRAARRAWLANISEKAIAQVAAAGGVAADGTGLKTAADNIITAYDSTDSAQTTLDGKRAEEIDTEATEIVKIREILRRLKVLAGFVSSGASAQLQASASASDFDPSTYKPVITVSIKGGQITIEFKKRGVSMLAIYCRLRGTTTWTRLGTDSSSPYIDGHPLANPGVPEVREYMARGMIDDEEIGLESDIVSIAYAG